MEDGFFLKFTCFVFSSSEYKIFVRDDFRIRLEFLLVKWELGEVVEIELSLRERNFIVNRVVGG